MDLRVKCLLILIAGVLCVGGVYLLAGTPAQQEDAVSPLAPHPDAAGDIAAEQAVVAANNRFAIDLYHTLAGDITHANQNIFFSPSSISTAFTITAEGARGRTLDEIQNVFHLPADPGVWRNGNSRIYATLNAPGANYTLSTANALYAEKTYRFLPEYTSVAQKYYHANTTNMDFIGHPEESRQFINRQVELQTRDRIHDLLPEHSISQDTRLVITNAIYFSGSWSTAFEKRMTSDGAFRTPNGSTLNVPMMQRQAEFPYTETGEYQAIALPYNKTGGRPLSMLVLLPRENALAGFEADLSSEAITSIRKNLTSQKVLVSLPSFTLDTSYDLKVILPGMGMPTAFNEDADFSGMDGSGGSYIAKAIHKAFVEVDESGTEAAAATAVVMMVWGGNWCPSFRADHPFVFLILDDESSNILFLGRMAAPSQAS